MPLSPLPIDAVLPEVVAGLHAHASLVLRAPTGAGKTTRVPPALLDAGFAQPGQIIVLEPRRLAARAAARRMAHERGTSLGQEIGYQVRFDKQHGPSTRIVVVTPGVLLGWLHDNPYLEQASVVVFDEFHERGLESDLALGMIRLIQQTVRPELRIVVMSATLETELLAAYLGACPVVTSEGRLHPVELQYQARPEAQPWSSAAAAGVEHLLSRTPGDVLVFLPGMQEIRQTAKRLEKLAQTRDLLVLPLHGDLPADQQDAALQPQPRRKVVLATNVAETSVTVEGVTGVVDTGLARLLVFDAGLGLDRLKLTPISRASADQRAGRAGRTQPGICIRLWSELGQRARLAQTPPEIRRVDLAGALLHLLCLGETELLNFPLLEAPRPETIEHGLELLNRLGAVTGKTATAMGQRLARLPVHPRLGKLLLEGERHGIARRGALAAALLSERDPFERCAGPQTGADVLDRLEAMECFERSRQLQSPAGVLHRGGAHAVLQARDQLLRNLRGPKDDHTEASDAMVRALLAAFPDRVVRRREGDTRRGLMVGGRGVRLNPGSGAEQGELVLAINVDAGQQESLVRLGATVQRRDLPADLVRSTIDLFFDEETERVSARRRVRYLDLLLEESPAALPEGDQIARVLAEAARVNLDRVLPPADSDAGRFLLRVRCLRVWMPELDLPAFTEDALRELLPWLCAGKRSFEDLRRGDWLGLLQGPLSRTQLLAVDREAPDRLEVPSGSRLALHYEEGRPPVLAVRIQELFGLSETPRVAGGRVPVLLHLLAPNYRPQQVTADLASFWANTYAQVRKDLRARYPRHAWPEDPTQAMAERRPRRRERS